MLKHWKQLFCKEANELYLGHVLPEGEAAFFLLHICPDLNSLYSLSQKQLQTYGFWVLSQFMLTCRNLRCGCCLDFNSIIHKETLQTGWIWSTALTFSPAHGIILGTAPKQMQQSHNATWQIHAFGLAESKYGPKGVLNQGSKQLQSYLTHVLMTVFVEGWVGGVSDFLNWL